MEHRTLDELSRVADTGPLPEARPRMSRRERLERWASLLESFDGRLLPLERIEFVPWHERMHMRRDSSPLVVAFNDPVLREEGLASDEFGAALDFFGLTQGQGHRLLCDCHYHGGMTGKETAERLRVIAGGGIVGLLWRQVRQLAAKWVG
ncbi:hypothetical protein QNA08_00155 [Chelatococcus sp. SYSU_G07232]|uniref:Uncharacterized protein n=1 Tax=Chelatococcus albus TaxID=3047466 RepID=A0ABT7ABC1_9HYPH|nr:hypothetical protein [Chelatococcus sp. SYSU_G07232]MDJ1156663.1 hypothetical protein [Chelatococcus sp. SYSU_G07232]